MNILLDRKYVADFLFYIIIVLSCVDVLRGGGLFSWLPFIFLILVLFFSGKMVVDYSLIIAFAFSFIIVINSFISSDPVNTFARSSKVFLILILAIGLKNSKISFKVVSGALLSVVFANMVLIAFGLMGYETLAFSGAGYRWETLLSRPGTLYVPALLILSFILSDGLLQTKYFPHESKLMKGFWIILSLILIVADGSRSAMLLFAIALLIFLFFSKKSLKNIGYILIFVIFSVMSFYALSEYFFEKFSFERFTDFISSAGLAEADPARVHLMKSAIDWIVENNPLLLGRGFSTTIIGDYFELVVHNAYILVWEQLGLFALVIFIFIVFMPIFTVARFYLLQRDLRLVMPLICFIFFSFQLFIHPFATDYGPWVYYFLGNLFFGRFFVLRNSHLNQ